MSEEDLGDGDNLGSPDPLVASPERALEPADQQQPPGRRPGGAGKGALVGTCLGGLIGLILASTACSSSDPLGLCGAFQAIFVVLGLLGGAVIGAVVGALVRARMSPRSKVVLAASVIVLIAAGIVAAALPPGYPPCPAGTNRVSGLVADYVYCLPPEFADAPVISSGFRGPGSLSFGSPDEQGQTFYPIARHDRQTWRIVTLSTGFGLSVSLLAWNFRRARRQSPTSRSRP